MTRDEMDAVAALCRRHDLWAGFDEVYEDLAFARSACRRWSLPGMAERAAVISSLSNRMRCRRFAFGWIGRRRNWRSICSICCCA